MAMSLSASSLKHGTKKSNPDIDIEADLGERRRLQKEGKTGSDQDAPVERPLLPYYTVAQNLLWIEKHPVWSKVLQEADRNESLLTSRIASKRNTGRILTTEVYQLLGIYCVFQALLLVAVSASTLLRCDDTVFPIALSVAASVFFVFGVTSKLLHVKHLEDFTAEEIKKLTEVSNIAQNLREKGERFKDDLAAHPISAAHRPPIRRLVLQLLVRVGVLIIFQVVWVFPLFHRRILCGGPL